MWRLDSSRGNVVPGSTWRRSKLPTVSFSSSRKAGTVEPGGIPPSRLITAAAADGMQGCCLLHLALFRLHRVRHLHYLLSSA